MSEVTDWTHRRMTEQLLADFLLHKNKTPPPLSLPTSSSARFLCTPNFLPKLFKVFLNLVKMASTTSRIRNKLDALWDALLHKDMSQNLGENQAVKPIFLESKQIYLIDHDFSSTKVEDRYPPVLFEPCPQSLLDRNPVDIADYDDSRFGNFGNRVTQFQDYVAGGEWSGVRDCTDLVSSKLESWAYTFTRRDTTSAFVNLQEMRSIYPIEYAIFQHSSSH
jgi:hypothetical protein